MSNERFRLAALQSAMRHGRRLDGSERVLSRSEEAHAGPKAYMPPYVVAGYQTEPLMAAEAGTPAPTQGDQRLPVRQFERLSLAARVGLFQSRKYAKDCGPAQAAAHRALEADAASLDLAPDRFPIIHPDDINAALAWGVDNLDPGARDEGGVRGRRGERPAVLMARQSLRGGLQIVGCRITAATGDSLEVGAIRLANAKLPFSLRLIGCVIECPIIMSNCDLVTLDLSGSAMAGLDATYLGAEGSIRLRRSMVLAPVDFAGARVRGVFDATDCLIGPQLPVPDGQAFDADRGMLNLAQMSVDNDVFLERARIWGGLSLRGAETRRSIFMNDAVVTAPAAILEAWASDRGLLPSDDSALRASGYNNHAWDLARSRLHDPELPPDLHAPLAQVSDAAKTAAAALSRLETLKDIGWNAPQLVPLLSQSMRARTSAIRADGVKVQGSIFARGLKASGRTRLKYAEISGGLHMDGAILRSISAVGDRLNLLAKTALGQEHGDPQGLGAEISELRRRTKFMAQIGDGAFDDDYALDVRDATISGDFSLGSLTAAERDAAEEEALNSLSGGAPDSSLERLKQLRVSFDREFGASQVSGMVTLAGARIDGSAKFVRLEVLRRPKAAALKIGHPLPGASASPLYKVVADQGGPAAVRRLRKANAEMALGAMARTVDLGHCQIGDDVDFRESKWVFGVNLEHATVEGSVKFSGPAKSADGCEAASSPPVPSSSFVRCQGRTEGLAGSIDLRGATVRGDVLLVFDPDHGPDILAELVRIDGRLEIYPSQRAGEPDRPIAFWKTHPTLARALKFASRRPWMKVLTDRLLMVYRRLGLPARPTRRRYEIEGDGPARSSGLGFSLSWSDFRARVREANADRRILDGFATKARSGQWASRPRAWSIDLSNACAAVFTHPPAAWPHPGGLALAGFRYERTTDIGPLAPHPFPPEPRARGLKISMLMLGVGLLVYALILPLFNPDASPIRVSHWLIHFFGRFNILLLIIYLIVFYAIQIARLILPTRATSEPMALNYFRLQRLDQNRYRTRPHLYSALDPYLIGAKALREEGRDISANLVEKTRMKERTRTLSWRHHFLAKLGLHAVGLTADYGYSLSRTVGVLILTVIIGAGTSYYAMTHQALVAIAPAARGSADPPPQAAHDARHANARSKGQGAHAAAGPDPTTSSTTVQALVYTGDQLLPFLSIGEKDKWRSQVPAVTARWIRSLPAKWERGAIETLFLGWPLILRVLGLGLTTILVVALSARAAPAFKRVEE